MDTPESLRKEAARYQAEAQEHHREADYLEGKADALQDEADQLEDNHQQALRDRAMDICSIAKRLLSGYLSGSALELVMQVLDEGKELPGFRDVCATYGEALP